MKRVVCALTTSLLLTGAAYQYVRAQGRATERPVVAAGPERPVLACNPAAMTAEQRHRHSAIGARLRKAMQQVKELPDGYAFRYGHSPELFLAAAEFASLEGECCPFYRFALEQEAGHGAIWLRVTGPSGTKAFIKAALAP
jgi:hypothetical protein